MKLRRRGFLKLLGGTAAATVAAPLLTSPASGPLFIPSERLDMGVPRRILTATTIADATTVTIQSEGHWQPFAANIPMLLVHAEFRPPGWRQFGREKVPAGTTLWVDLPTAERWVTYGVGTPGPGAPAELQEAAARRAARQTRTMRWENKFLNHEEIATLIPLPETLAEGGDRHWSRAIAAMSWQNTFLDVEAVGSRVPIPEAVVEERNRHWSRAIERASAKLKRVARTPDMAWWDSHA